MMWLDVQAACQSCTLARWSSQVTAIDCCYQPPPMVFGHDNDHDNNGDQNNKKFIIINMTMTMTKTMTINRTTTMTTT